MGDSTEELEPLFDYRRVQPANFISLEDDSDSSPSISPKRRKTSKPSKNEVEYRKGGGKTVEVIDCEEVEDQEDWLPPPPKNAAGGLNLQEDSTIKELRLKKQELASLVQSTEEALRAAEEASKRTLTTSSRSSVEETNEEAQKLAPDRAKIVIPIQDKAGTKQYRIFVDDKFEQLFKKYAEKARIDVQNLVFSFDGDKISPSSTPESLDMEDGDLIEVHVKAR